jgi:protein-tyrosine-phosphatase
MSSGNPVLQAYPNSAFNAFLMMRFAEQGSEDPIVNVIRAAFARYAIDVLRADDRAFCDSLWDNVRAYMEASDFGVAVFDQAAAAHFNPNVSLELGYMLALAKRVLLLKERSLPRLHSDLVGHLYKEFDHDQLELTVTRAVTSWLQDVGVAKAPSEKLVVFVSYGGTCRCAMSKVVAQQAFAGRSLPFPLRFESMAFHYGSTTRASDGAREAIREAFGADLLATHRVMKKNPGIIDDADLILVMGSNLATGFPPEKTRVIKEFFAGSGCVDNPYAGKGEFSEKYRKCLAELREIIEPNVDRILDGLQPKTL